MSTPAWPATVADGKPGISANGTRVASVSLLARPPSPEPRMIAATGGSVRRRARTCSAAARAAEASCSSSGIEAVTLLAERGDLPFDLREQLLPLLPRQKRGREAVAGHLGELVEGEAKVSRGELVLVGEHGVAHQPIVGIEHDVHAAVE